MWVNYKLFYSGSLMKSINDILSQKDILSMFPKIQAYYAQYLGIEVSHQIIRFAHDSDPDKTTDLSHVFPYKIVNSNKIPQHADIQAYQNGKVLDPGEIAAILVAHLSTKLEQKNLELETLITLKQHIEYLKSQHLNSDFIDDNPEACVIVRYLDGLYFSVLQKIKQKLYTKLSEPDYQSDALVHQLNELSSILPHLNMPDLLDFQNCLDDLQTDNNIPSDLLEELQPFMQAISTKIKKNIQHTLHFMIHDMETETSLLNERLPTLKSQIQMKHALQTMQDVAPKLVHFLDLNIKTTILGLLERYELEVKNAILETKKEQKMQLIVKLKGLCRDTVSSDDLYQEIIRHGDLLKNQSIGRYIYECICWLFRIKIPTERHSVTLFQAVTTGKKIPDSSKDVPNQIQPD